MTARKLEEVPQATICQAVDVRQCRDHAMPFLDARCYARRTMRQDKSIRTMDIVTLRADDSVELTRFNANGSFRRIVCLLDSAGNPA